MPRSLLQSQVRRDEGNGGGDGGGGGGGGVFSYIKTRIRCLFLITHSFPTDRPDPPSAPTITDVSGTALTLRWDPPRDDGGCRISNYIVEYFRVSVVGVI